MNTDRREIGKIVRCLPDKNVAELYSSCYCTDRAQNLPELVPENILRVLQMSSKSAHFRPSYSRTREQSQVVVLVVVVVAVAVVVVVVVVVKMSSYIYTQLSL